MSIIFIAMILQIVAADGLHSKQLYKYKSQVLIKIFDAESKINIK